jgi:hypothetical protein
MTMYLFTERKNKFQDYFLSCLMTIMAIRSMARAITIKNIIVVLIFFSFSLSRPTMFNQGVEGSLPTGRQVLDIVGIIRFSPMVDA